MSACTPEERLRRARLSLEGLALGDAFGDQFFSHPHGVEALTQQRTLPPAPWAYTDDTEMALSVYACLRSHGTIHQGFLARSFAERYDPQRGYGSSMHGLLAAFREGQSWQEAAPAQFNGRGSWGNGAAMRVAPLGAYFADRLERAAAEAAASAVVTHSHPEAVAGAVAVAAAAALAWEATHQQPAPRSFLDAILNHVPQSLVREKLRHARQLPEGCSVSLAVSALGNGTKISAADTVPFALRCAAQHLNSYEEALWLTASGLGDRDTTCAIVGGIVALSAREVALPTAWLNAREPLPEWAFG